MTCPTCGYTNLAHCRLVCADPKCAWLICVECGTTFHPTTGAYRKGHHA